MGRGQARLRRLAEYFNRLCLPCAEQHAREHLNTLTDTKGNLRPASEQVVNDRLARVRAGY